MATENVSPPDGFEEVESKSDNEDYDTSWVDRPELGDMLQGVLLSVNPNKGKYDSTVLEIRLTEPYGDEDDGELVAVWATDGIANAIEESDARGSEIAIWCDSTSEIDGTEVRNYKTGVKGEK